MPVLALPSSPAFSASRFGLVSNTQVFENPLTGQTQTLERPGARWRCEYTLPPMKRAQAAIWQGFLAQLRGGAGRFYGYDPDARSPRGTALANALASRNEIRNGNALGAVAGVVGAGGAAPTNWVFGPANGLTRTIVGSGSENGISYVEIRFAGTPTATSAAITYDISSSIVCAEGESWTSSVYYRLSAGSTANIAAVQQYISQTQANGTINVNSYSAVGTVDGTWRRAAYTKVLADTTPDTVRIKSGFYLLLTIGQAIDITLRLGQAQLERAAAASLYIPTTGNARSRDAGPRVDGAASAGTTLATWNWQPSQANVLRAGDYVAFDTSAGRELHMLTADASADAAGRAVLQFEPPLRTPPPDNTALITSAASCTMALEEASISWQADAQGVYRLSFSAIERF